MRAKLSAGAPRLSSWTREPLAALLWPLLVGLTGPAAAHAQEPPDTVQVDSTLLRIEQRLQGLARPPGLDSTYFLPDSLLPDSLRQIREAQREGRPVPASTSAPARPLAGGDSIMAALLALPGYTATQYQGEGADFEAKDRRLVLFGTPDQQARIIADGQELTADSAVVYSEETKKVWTLGSEAVFQPPNQDAVTSRAIVFDLNQERGTALDARTKYSGGAEWLVHGELTSVTDTASFGSELSFTSCELEVPHYHFASNNVKIVRGKVMVARPVKLYFADVPVAWLPFIAQSLSQGRASGILTPTFSVNDIVRASQSYRRRVSNIGFYWAMSDYYDSTVSLDWWSGQHVALTGSLNYAWARQFLNGSLNYRQFWRADGSKERAFDGNTSWQMSERTNLRFSARYASSSSFVRQTSFDPMEVVQSINSEGGLSHRFDFGNLTFAANRRQFLSDDRVEMVLPSVSLSLSPQTFFKAPASRAKFYNNLTWSGSASFRRNSFDRPARPDTVPFSPSLADQVNTTAGFRTGFSLGNVSLSTSMDASESLVRGVPVSLAVPSLDLPEGRDPGQRVDNLPLTNLPSVFQDSATTKLSWNASLGYQVRLIGATTLTPSLSLSSQLYRSDRDSLASSFVSAPTRFSMGVSLRTDIYGFFPGFGPFEAIRHKLSPGFDFSYAPKVTPTPLQENVFRAGEIGAQRVLRISLNQTFEAKRKEEAAQPAAGASGSQPQEAQPADTLGLAPDTLVADSLLADTLDFPLSPAAQQQQAGQKVTLLALQTTAVTYDFEKAAEEGNWLWGIQTTQITNTISSDYLRGLNLTVTHDLFQDTSGETDQGSAQTAASRKFSPRLTRMNFNFSMDSNSLPFRLLGRLLGWGTRETGQPPQAAEPPGEEEGGLAGPGLTSDASVIPRGSMEPRRAGGNRGGVGGWRANVGYSLQRPRGAQGQQSNQMIQGDLTFNATEKWQVSWRTSYDVTSGSFNDHTVRLTRDLHRWQANFDFRQTVTGNWSFFFEVSLLDNEDLHFDYQQRTTQGVNGRQRF